MGLGLFIAQTLLGRYGARLAFGNRREGGARVSVTWDRANAEGIAGGGEEDV
jgi:two-component system sensor histidine kinase RegB